ncbi:MAG: hypothetical protein O3C04_03090 [Crenarchaeota archaeon]|nr:hypothetical protein [Thermoproteota archaeon]
MNRKILVLGVIGALALVIMMIATSGTSIIDDTASDVRLGTSNAMPTLIPLIIELEDIEILNIDERIAFVEISFKVINPNYKGIILEMIRYNVYEDGMKIGTKSIGDRAAPGGIVSASNYFTILSDRPSIISDKFTIKNNGNIPELWNVLENGDPTWRVTGEAYYNLSSMTAGGENEVTFEFTR